MSINISSAFVKTFDVAIWRINFLINPLIFKGPLYNCTTLLLINCMKCELKHLKTGVDASPNNLNVIVLFSLSTDSILSRHVVTFPSVLSETIKISINNHCIRIINKKIIYLYITFFSVLT